MSNLPSNTQYGTPITQPSIANLSAMVKKIQENAQKTSNDVVTKTLDPHFNPNDYNAIFGNGQPKVAPVVQPNVNFQTGIPITQALSNASFVGGVPYAPDYKPTLPYTPTEPIPSTYTQFAPTDTNTNWVDPSTSSVFRNLPADLGGGQYITDPTQPGKMIKSTRAIMDYKISPGMKQQVLGNLAPSLFQVDHIIPLWVGGADTLANLEVYPNPTHAIKTAVQSVPLTLLANNLYLNSDGTTTKILPNDATGKQKLLNQAKLMAINWNSVDKSGLPTQEELDANGGYTDVTKATKLAKQWQDAVTKPITNVFDPRALKYFGSSFAENMSNFGKDIPVVGEFAE